MVIVKVYHVKNKNSMSKMQFIGGTSGTLAPAREIDREF